MLGKTETFNETRLTQGNHGMEILSLTFNVERDVLLDQTGELPTLQAGHEAPVPGRGASSCNWTRWGLSERGPSKQPAGDNGVCAPRATHKCSHGSLCTDPVQDSLWLKFPHRETQEQKYDFGVSLI